MKTVETYENEWKSKYRSARAAAETDEEVADTMYFCWKEMNKACADSMMSCAYEYHTLLLPKHVADNPDLSYIIEEETNIPTSEFLVDLRKGSGERESSLGKNSFSKEFILKFATVVTEFTDYIEFPSEFAAAERVADLKVFRYAYVAKASNAMKYRILLEEEVRSTMQSWINQMETQFIKNGGSWLDLIRKDLFKSFWEFGLGLKHIHEKGYIFEGSLEDLIKTPTVVKIVKVRKPKDAEDSSEIKKLGLSADDLNFVSQLEKMKDTETMAPLYFIFENPIFYDVKQRRAYMKELVALATDKYCTSNR